MGQNRSGFPVQSGDLSADAEREVCTNPLIIPHAFIKRLAQVLFVSRRPCD